MPIDQRGVDLLFQVISQRYQRGSIVITSDKAFKQWFAIFNGDSTIDPSTGKAASAKNPSRWPNLFNFRAFYTEAVESRSRIPPFEFLFRTVGLFSITTQG